MRVERGASQLLFGLLPAQTVDLQGRVWRVIRWVEPKKLPLDQATVRKALEDAIAPWVGSGNDDGLGAELHGGAIVDIVGVNPDGGAVVEAFPRQWRCRQCGRLYSDRVERCKCNAQAPLAQMQFVAYHTCGRFREPWIKRCPTHQSVAVRLPGTATARELYFFCPDCKRTVSQGFPFLPCDCGEGGMQITVHRAGAVFSPQFAALVNPPDPAGAAKLRARGGGATALEWVLDGIDTRDFDGASQTFQSFVDMLVQTNIDPEYARELAEDAVKKGQIKSDGSANDLDIPELTRERAQEEALSLTSAVDEGRTCLKEMVEHTSPPLQTLYSTAYPTAMSLAKLSNVELLTEFPVATLAFGYTRGGLGPGESRLISFREKGGLRAYGSLNKTEALLFQLDPMAVHRFLVAHGSTLDSAATAREARLAILRSVVMPLPLEQHVQPLGDSLVTLIHSYAHRMIRTLAAYAGIERDSLAEYLVPHHVSFVVYAAARGDFVLGGLQAVFETSLDRVLQDFVTGEIRCPLDPGCRSGGGACMACLHLGEPSCRWFNRYLDRSSLFGAGGYLLKNVNG